MKYVLHFGGGVNSCALYFVLRENNFPLDLILFADTGSELPETYATVRKFKELAERDGIPFVTVYSELAYSLYEYCESKRILPSRMRRDCTHKFKIRPMRAYLRGAFGKAETFTAYIGIALEESTRMRTSDVNYITNSYPLIDNRIDRRGCLDILAKHGITDVVKSGCYFCPFTPKAGWIWLMDTHPELLEKAARLEENRSNAKVLLSSIPLRKLIDARKNQTKLKDYDTACDISGSCFL